MTEPSHEQRELITVWACQGVTAKILECLLSLTGSCRMLKGEVAQTSEPLDSASDQLRHIRYQNVAGQYLPRQ